VTSIHTPEPLSPLVLAALRDLAERFADHKMKGFVMDPERSTAITYLRALRFVGDEKLDPRQIEKWAERSGYRNLILTISPRKNETPKRRNAETPNHDHPCHAHAFGRGE
jgi:hypothetical protein